MQTDKNFRQHWPIILMIIINIAIGLAVFRDYGQSWDEPGIQKYAGQSLSAYTRLFRNEAPPVYESDLMYYGPAFGMLGMLMVQALMFINSGGMSIDYWHLAYFLSFQIAVLSLFFLSRRWMSHWAAFSVATLFASQPLLWGHAFINPKDIPFMGFFLLSVTLGFRMVEKRIVAHAPEGEILQPSFTLRELASEWIKKTRIGKWITIVVVALWLCLGAFLLLFNGLIRNIIASMVILAYKSGGQNFWGRLFTRLAPNASHVPVESYIEKAQTLSVRWEGFIFLLSGLVIAILLLKLISPVGYRRFIEHGIKPGFKSSLVYLKIPIVFISATVLGLTISIRVLGPYAGVLVGLYALWKVGRKSVFAMFPYYGVALLVSYLTWPYLWRDPIGRFIKSMGIMFNFVQPNVLPFQGGLVESAVLPWYYLPKLMMVQLTEPVLILFIAGLVIALLHLKSQKYLEPFLLWMLWLLLPVLGMVVSHSSLYDNFRQLLFVLPPIFIMGGLVLDKVFSRFNRVWLNLLVIAVIAIPGISASFHLHPYEYIYFNSFVGGVKSAFRHYELDYWATSYKEAAEYLNEVAPTNAKIGVVGTDLIFNPYARPDLEVSYFNGVDVNENFDYVVVTSRANNDLGVCPRAKVIKIIEREGAVLASIKHISSPEECILSP
jgi:hypothetical protein